MEREMIRTIKNVQIITYRVHKDEIINAIIHKASTEDGLRLLSDPTHIEGMPEIVDFVYEHEQDTKTEQK